METEAKKWTLLQDIPKNEKENRQIYETIGLINKLTANNFKKLSEDIIKTQFKTKDDIKKIAEIIFNKMIYEDTFRDLYINIIDGIENRPYDPSNEEDSALAKTFKRHFIENCQKEFFNVASKKTIDLVERKRALGIIAMLVFLFKKNYLPNVIFKKCLVNLINKASIDNDSLEYCCIMIKEHNDYDYSQLVDLVDMLLEWKNKIKEKRICFLIEDTLDILNKHSVKNSPDPKKNNVIIINDKITVKKK